jgi:hypothetical protein
MKITNIINESSNWKPEGSWKDGNPYTMMFVYGISGKKTLIKGGSNQLEILLNEIEEPSIVHVTYFHKGKSRNNINCINFGEYKVYMHNKTILAYKNSELILEKRVKRFPRCFPKELKTILKQG